MSQNIMKMIVIMTEFRNDYKLPNLTDEEKTCYKISQNQICIDILQIIDGQKVFQTRSH